LNARLRYGMDFDLWQRFAEHPNLVAVEAKLAAFRIHPAQKTADLAPYYAEIGMSLPPWFRALALPTRAVLALARPLAPRMVFDGDTPPSAPARSSAAQAAKAVLKLRISAQRSRSKVKQIAHIAGYAIVDTAQHHDRRPEETKKAQQEATLSGLGMCRGFAADKPHDSPDTPLERVRISLREHRGLPPDGTPAAGLRYSIGG
jgi:hypothetical protein